MINSEVNSNVMGNTGSDMPPDHKQSPLVKKIALRDVQNDNRGLMGKHQETSPILKGRPITDAIKVSGTKRLTPECPLSPTVYPSLSRNGVNEHLVDAQIKFEAELGKGRIRNSAAKSADHLQLSSKQSFHKQQGLPQQQTQRESNLYSTPVVRPNQMASITNLPYGGPSIPSSIGRTGNVAPAAESKCPKVKSEVCHSVDSKVACDQQRKDRFLRLQKFLKECDESSQKDYVQLLSNLSPAELSRHAVELEKRAIQLTVEEGKQMQLMKALNILGKSGPTNNTLLTTQQPQSKK